MAKADLRSAQEPLKERFRSEPSAALVTLRAEASLGDGITASVPTHIGAVVAGLHPATGGDGLSACSGDMLLEALGACAGVTLLAVATSLNIEVRAGSVHVEGDLDFRGTLGVSRRAPVGFTDIRVAYELDTDASDEQLDTLIRLTERYCVVYQTLANSPSLSVSRRQLEGTA
ncbi:MAG: OsmC family protein [Actinomycetota bacterium]|nr:OsmC family protein [Actinomycetota bacterium]